MSRYYGRVNTSFKRQSINAAVKNLKIAEEKISDEIIREAAEAAKERAEELYLDAQYDGATPDIEVSVYKSKSGNYLIKASGEAVLFIEYGTGQHKGSKEYWFYTLPEDYTFGTESGDFAHYKRNMKDDLGDQAYYLKGKNGGMILSEKKFERLMDSGSFKTEADAKKFQNAHKAKEWVEKPYSGFTRGNPAQHVMRQALEYAQDYLRERYDAK